MSTRHFFSSFIRLILNLFNRLPTKEEVEIRRTLRRAKTKLKNLNTAAAKDEQIKKQLFVAQAELTQVLKKVPLGCRNMFWGNCAWIALLLFFSVSYYLLLNPLFVNVMWGTPDNRYLQEYRPFAACLWEQAQFVMATPWFVLVPILYLSGLWFFQRHLYQWSARRLLGIARIATILFALFFSYSLGTLMFSPL